MKVINFCVFIVLFITCECQSSTTIKASGDKKTENKEKSSNKTIVFAHPEDSFIKATSFNIYILANKADKYLNLTGNYSSVNTPTRIITNALVIAFDHDTSPDFISDASEVRESVSVMSGQINSDLA